MAELIRRKKAGELRNRDVQAWIKQPSSAVSNLFSGSRRIQQSEMPVISAQLWPDESIKNDPPVTITDILCALEALLKRARVEDAVSAAILDLLPASAEAVRSAASKGLDRDTAAATSAEILWPQDRDE